MLKNYYKHLIVAGVMCDPGNTRELLISTKTSSTIHLLWRCRHDGKWNSKLDYSYFNLLAV